MTPQECIEQIEQECPVIFWAESASTFPTTAHGFLEDGTPFMLNCDKETAELIVGEYDPETELPYSDFYSKTLCSCKTMEEYIDIFKQLVYTLDKPERKHVSTQERI